MLMKILIISIVGILTGCGGGGETEKSPKEKIAELEATGAIPKLERGNTIEGVDANANGVRDDVEAFIANNYTSTAQHAAAMQYARGMQSALTVDTNNIDAVKNVKRKLSKASRCIYSRFDEKTNSTKHPAEVNAELRAISTNTKQRLTAYLAYSKALDGASWAMPEGDGCE